MIIKLTKRNDETILLNTDIILIVTTHPKGGSLIEVKGRGQYGDIEVKETIEEIENKLGSR